MVAIDRGGAFTNCYINCYATARSICNVKESAIKPLLAPTSLPTTSPPWLYPMSATDTSSAPLAEWFFISGYYHEISRHISLHANLFFQVLIANSFGGEGRRNRTILPKRPLNRPLRKINLPRRRTLCQTRSRPGVSNVTPTSVFQNSQMRLACQSHHSHLRQKKMAQIAIEAVRRSGPFR